MTQPPRTVPDTSAPPNPAPRNWAPRNWAPRNWAPRNWAARNWARRTGSAKRTGAAAAAVGIIAAVLAPALATGPAAAVPAPESCSRFGAAAAGDLVTLRLLDLRPLGVQLAPVVDLKLATTRAGLTGAGGRSAAQGKYVQGTVLGLRPPLGPLDASAYQLAPPVNQHPTVVNPGRIDLGVARAGTGDLYAKAAYRDAARCDAEAGAGADASAALIDAAVLPGRRALLHAHQNLSSTAHTGLIRHQGGTAAEAASTAGLVDLSLLGSTKVRVISRPTLRAVAGGSKGRSAVEYSAPGLAVDLPGQTVELSQPAQSVDLAVPVPGGFALPGLPSLPAGALNDVLGALPGMPSLLPGVTGVVGGGQADAEAAADADSGVASAGGRSEVSASAGAESAPAVPGLNSLSGVPAVGGLLGGAGRLTAPAGRTAVVLRLTAGELSQEITDNGVHAKAISLRLKLLLVRGSAVSTIVDLCIGVLEVAATAPRGGRTGGGGGYGPPGGGGNPAGTQPPGGNASGATPPVTGGGTGSGSTPGTGTGTSTGTGTGTAQPGNGGANGGRLPVTGNALSLIIGTGVVLLAAGRLLMLLTRRRPVA